MLYFYFKCLSLPKISSIFSSRYHLTASLIYFFSSAVILINCSFCSCLKKLVTAISILFVIHSYDIFIFNLFHSILSLHFYLFFVCFVASIFVSIILNLCKILNFLISWNICGLFLYIPFQNRSWTFFMISFSLEWFIIFLCIWLLVSLMYLHLSNSMRLNQFFM